MASMLEFIMRYCTHGMTLDQTLFSIRCQLLRSVTFCPLFGEGRLNHQDFWLVTLGR